jgi:hypothetical protein
LFQNENIFSILFSLNDMGSLYLRPEKQIVLLKAEVAHLVEHDLAKVGVAGSSPVFRSQFPPAAGRIFFGALVVELVDTQDLKSCDPQRS